METCEENDDSLPAAEWHSPPQRSEETEEDLDFAEELELLLLGRGLRGPPPSSEELLLLEELLELLVVAALLDELEDELLPR